MIRERDIQQVIELCQVFAKNTGLRNGKKANINHLRIDFLSPPNDFLGLSNNIAIFINDHTFRLLHQYHPNWVVNETIAVKDDFINYAPMLAVAVIAHEAGHAFNVAAQQANTEASAYLFEIEFLLYLRDFGGLDFFTLNTNELNGYFNSRMSTYRKEMKVHSGLRALIQEIDDNKENDNKSSLTLKKADGTTNQYAFFQPKMNTLTPTKFKPSQVPNFQYFL